MPPRRAAWAPAPPPRLPGAKGGPAGSVNRLPTAPSGSAKNAPNCLVFSMSPLSCQLMDANTRAAIGANPVSRLCPTLVSSWFQSWMASFWASMGAVFPSLARPWWSASTSRVPLLTASNILSAARPKFSVATFIASWSLPASMNAFMRRMVSSRVALASLPSVAHRRIAIVMACANWLASRPASFMARMTPSVSWASNPACFAAGPIFNMLSTRLLMGVCVACDAPRKSSSIAFSA